MAIPFPVVHCPPLVRKAADEFKDFMTPIQYQAFVAVLCASVFGIAGYCDVMRYIQFSPSVTSIWELFHAAQMVEKLNRRHKRRLLRLLKDLEKDPARYQWVIDDTLLERHGEKIWGAYNWHDHVTNGYLFGHKLLVIGIEDRKRNLLIPVAWEILHRDLDEEKSSPGAPPHEKGWEVALRLLRGLTLFGFPKLTVTADSWFAGEELFQALDKDGYSFEIEIRCNRKVARHGQKRLDIRVDAFFSTIRRSAIYFGAKQKYAAESTLIFRDSTLRLKVVAVANHKSIDDEAFAYYVTNKLTWNASRVWAHARDRWGIEVQFRELKQLFTLGEAAVRSKKAVETSISVAAIALTVIRLEQLAKADANEDQKIRPVPAGSIVRDLQVKAMLDSISKLASKTETRYRNRFHARVNHENLNGKPAEVRRTAKVPVAHRVEAEAA
jgi:hypothetical protein